MLYWLKKNHEQLYRLMWMWTACRTRRPGETAGNTYFPLPAAPVKIRDPEDLDLDLDQITVRLLPTLMLCCSRPYPIYCHSTTPHPCKKLSDAFKWASHSCRSSGNATSSHGFRGPLKCSTAESRTRSGRGTRQPRPGRFHRGSIAWTRPSNASRAGGSEAICHSLKPDSRFCTWRRDGKCQFRQQRGHWPCMLQFPGISARSACLL
jgi:hypothetical protein